MNLNLTNILGHTGDFLKKHSSTILTCIGAVGVVTTAVMTAKVTPKAIELLEEAEAEKDEELTLTEKVIIAVPVYIPPVVMGVATIACIFGANALNQKQQAALTSAYALLSSSYNEYKHKVDELYGDEAGATVRKAIAEDRRKENGKSKFESSGEKLTFYLMERDEYFESTKEDVLAAEYHFNRNFILRGYANLNEFYEFLGLSKTEEGELLGWSIDAGCEFYGYAWVDFEHDICYLDDGMEYCVISMPFAPHPDWE